MSANSSQSRPTNPDKVARWGCLEKVDRGLGGFGDVVLV
jgi:hypothetical protein